MQPASARGFTIVEAIVALAIVTTGVLGLAGLARQVTDSVVRSRRHLSAAVFADAYVSMRVGQPLTVTAADCLQRDVAGCAEPLDGDGRPARGAPAFVRRWRVAPVPASPLPAWSLTVCVVPVDLRRLVARTPGACVSRVLTEGAP